jgi:hypothetical protein
VHVLLGLQVGLLDGKVGLGFELYSPELHFD